MNLSRLSHQAWVEGVQIFQLEKTYFDAIAAGVAQLVEHGPTLTNRTHFESH